MPSIRTPKLALIATPKGSSSLHLSLGGDPLYVETLRRSAINVHAWMDVEPGGLGRARCGGEALDEAVHVLGFDGLVLEEEDAAVANCTDMKVSKAGV